MQARLRRVCRAASCCIYGANDTERLGYICEAFRCMSRTSCPDPDRAARGAQADGKFPLRTGIGFARALRMRVVDRVAGCRRLARATISHAATPWRTSIDDRPAGVGDGGRDSPTQGRCLSSRAPDECLVGERREVCPGRRREPPCAAQSATRRRCRALPVRSPFMLFQNYTVWLNIVMANGSVAGRVHRGTCGGLAETRRAGGCSAAEVWVFVEQIAARMPCKVSCGRCRANPDPRPRGKPDPHPGCGPPAQILPMKNTRKYHYKALRYLLLIRLTHGRDRLS